MMVDLTPRQQRILWKGLLLYYHMISEDNEDLATEIEAVATVIDMPLSDEVKRQRREDPYCVFPQGTRGTFA